MICVLYEYYITRYACYTSRKYVSGAVMPDDFSANSSRESLWVGKTGPVKRSRASGWERVKLVLPCNTAKLGISLKFTVSTNLKVMFNKHNLSNMNC